MGRVANRLGPHSTAWAQAMIEARGIEGVRVLQGLLEPCGPLQCASAIEQPGERALGYGAFYLRTIRAAHRASGLQQELLPLLSDHPVIRPLSEYGQFVHEAIQSPEHSQMNQLNPPPPPEPRGPPPRRRGRPGRSGPRSVIN